MTSALIAILMLAAPAQAQRPSAIGIPRQSAPRDPLPRFTIAHRGGALAPIGLPLPQIGLRPPSSRAEPRRRFRHGAFTFWPMMVFYVPQPVVATPSPEPAAKPIEACPPLGG
jgi:hypothetical protein